MPLIRRTDPLGGGLMIAGGCVVILFGLVSFAGRLHALDGGAGLDLLAMVGIFVPDLIAILLGLFLIRSGHGLWTGKR